MIISTDFDGTLTEHTYELRELMNAMSATGHRTMVVSGRKNPEAIKDFLRQHGFPENMEIITKAENNSTTRMFKSKVLADNGVDIHFENDTDLSLPDEHPTKVLTFTRNRIKFGRVKW